VPTHPAPRRLQAAVARAATVALRLCRGGAIGYLAACVALAAAALLPLAAGWRATVVSGDSMRPALRPGDVLVHQPPVPALLAPGRLLVVRDAAAPHGLLAHRLARVEPDGDLRTKGDANPVVDSTPVAPGDVVGVARLVVPYAGLPALWRAGDGDGGRLAAWLGSVVLAGLLATGRGRRVMAA
jgi:signal peptidase